MTGGKHAKKREFSKIIISAVGAVTIVVTAFTLAWCGGPATRRPLPI